MRIQDRPSLVQKKGSAKFEQEDLVNMRKELLDNKKSELGHSI
jgi:hypothetical protein